MATPDEKTAEAESIVKKYMLGAAAVGLLPLPVIDMAALTGIQLKMLHRLSKLYGVEFREQLGKSAIATLLGSGLPISLSSQLSSFAKGLPIYGWVGALGTAAFGGASTFAIGRVFIQHFESGNTFLTFEPKKVREYYKEQLEQGKEEVRKSFGGIRP